MKYTLEELREMIFSMTQSLGRSPEELTSAIVELIKQDRQAQAVSDD